MQVLPSNPETVSILEYNVSEMSEMEDVYDEERKLFLHIGLGNGS